MNFVTDMFKNMKMTTTTMIIPLVVIVIIGVVIFIYKDNIINMFTKKETMKKPPKIYTMKKMNII